jgi:3-isopropylmalate/(R)-2-methylmalate dehydratase small subunit
MSGFEPFRRHTGIAASLLVDNVDTDSIFPAAFIRRMNPDYARALFANWRFRDGHSEENPEFVLNREPARRASILVTGDNFGCGSSREHAVWALKAWGIRAVIARSFGDIFHTNCFKNGLLAVELEPTAHASLAAAVDSTERPDTTIDLEVCEITAPDGSSLHFTLDPGHRHQLLHGLDEIGLTLENAADIDQFQARDRAQRPWVWTRPALTETQHRKGEY